MPELESPPTLNLRLGELRSDVEKLTQQANYETMSQFFRALINQLTEATDGKPFDVRDLVIQTKDKKSAGGKA